MLGDTALRSHGAGRGGPVACRRGADGPGSPRATSRESGIRSGPRDHDRVAAVLGTLVGAEAGDGEVPRHLHVDRGLGVVGDAVEEVLHHVVLGSAVAALHRRGGGAGDVVRQRQLHHVLQVGHALQVRVRLLRLGRTRGLERALGAVDGVVVEGGLARHALAAEDLDHAVALRSG